MEFISKLINPGSAAVVLLGAFFITFLGYCLGRISIKGVSLGTAGVFLTALLFGYLFTLPGLQEIPVLSKFFIADASASAMDSYGFIGDVGLVLFVTAVGSIAGPNFFRDLKKNAKTYLPMGAIIIIIGAGVAAAFALIPGIGSAFASGVLSGALTSTPAFSAAKEIAGDEAAMVSLGQAISYPFGVVGVVLFVQIMPKILRADMAKERALIAAPAKAEEQLLLPGFGKWLGTAAEFEPAAIVKVVDDDDTADRSYRAGCLLLGAALDYQRRQETPDTVMLLNLKTALLDEVQAIENILAQE